MKKHSSTVPAASNDNARGRIRFSLINSVSRWIRINRTARTLQSLDDRILDDIGVSRGDIRDIAARMADNENRRPAA